MLNSNFCKLLYQLSNPTLKMITRNTGLILMLIFYVLLFTSNKCKHDSIKQNKLICQERAIFGDPDTSEYILPFPVGKKYVCSQSCCNPYGGHANQLAYDFALQIGDTVIASRTGIVMEIRQDQPDNNENSGTNSHNYIMIEHIEGTVAFYGHLKQNSVLLEVGDSIKQGDFIALSGNSGYTANFPHLHFGVYQSYPPVETYDVPVNFKNADGPLNEHNGLIADQWYKALNYR